MKPINLKPSRKLKKNELVGFVLIDMNTATRESIDFELRCLKADILEKWEKYKNPEVLK